MTRYQVRSRELIDVINDIKNKRLIMSPYFQRNLVWRLIHKVDFIKTIVLGYPFPQIFIARGSIDLDSMLTTSCIVDGQQRMNAINEFLKDSFKVDNRYFSSFLPQEKEGFLKYQIPIIDLDINNDDPEIIEIFKRLNRTFYALSAIEKISTEYASSEYMLVAKFLCKELKSKERIDDEDEVHTLEINPNIPNIFFDWASTKKVKYYDELILERDIFTPYELTRQVHLNFTLNIMATYLSDFYNRNDFIERNLEEYSDVFPRKEEVFDIIEGASEKFLKLKLKKKSYWYNKANSFSLLCMFMKRFNSIKSLFKNS